MLYISHITVACVPGAGGGGREGGRERSQCQSAVRQSVAMCICR